MTNSDMQNVDSVVRHVNDLSEAIDKYGAGIVAMAIIYVLFIMIIIGFVIYFAKTAKQNQRRTDEFIKYLKDMSAKENNNNVVEAFIKSTNIIVDHLRYVCYETKCDRAAVYMFHNGQYLLNGAHLMKFSCCVEFALLTKHKYISCQKDVPINQIQDLCVKILNKEDLVFENIYHKDSTPFEEWHMRHDTKSVVVQPVYSKDGYILGFVSAEYYSEPIEKGDIKHTKELVHSLADKVSVTLDLNKQISG